MKNCDTKNNSGATGRAVDVRVKPIQFHLEGASFELEEKVQPQGGTMYEVARMQGIISKFVQCSLCGDLVQRRKAISLGIDLVCGPCSEMYVPDTYVYPEQQGQRS